MKIILKHDIFNITRRIKGIDRKYYVVYDTELNRYEIHSSRYKNSLCLVVPYKTLDCRVIKYLAESQNVEKKLEEIKNYNEKINKQNQENILDKSKYQLNEIYKYSNKKVSDFDGDAYLFNWC